MKSRGRSEQTETREDVRDMAEALSLFGSAMRHMADRQAVRHMADRQAVRMRAPKPRPARSLLLRLVLAPALGLAVAVAIAVPSWSHFQHDRTMAARHASLAAQQQENNTEARASVSDTVLMNQIDSDVSQEVPDALEPLAQLSEQAAATKTTALEKKNASQK